MTQQEKSNLFNYEKMLAELFKCKAIILCELGNGGENSIYTVHFAKKGFAEFNKNQEFNKKELDTICETRHVLFEKIK